MKKIFKSIIITTAIINFNTISSAACHKQLDDDHPYTISIDTPARPVLLVVKIGDSYKSIRTKISKILKAPDSGYEKQFEAGRVSIFSGKGNLSYADMETIRQVKTIKANIWPKSRKKQFYRLF